MKKILLSYLLLLCTCLVFAQTKNRAEVPLEAPQEDGFIRCNSTPYNEYLRQNNPNRATIEEFEGWMSQQVKRFNEDESLKNNEEIYTIPIIFHIVHRPVDASPAEGSTNILSDYVYAQIEQLNDDFRQEGLGMSMHPDAADVHIEFCAALYDPEGNELAEPGINRINPATHNPPLGAGIYSIAEFDDVVKRNTIWDPNQYCNFWSADLGGGVILGYAQFPDAPCVEGVGAGNGDADTDGVVCLYNTIGGEDKEAPNTNYALGRTGTHEIGHWLGLRHIWGDGDCTADDFVADTPNAGDSNGGCPAEFPNTCDDSESDYFNGTNPPDMMNNYMDYSNDICFDLFTNMQRTRMRLIMGDPDEECMGSPRRESLRFSQKCSPPAPLIGFASKSSTQVENTACNARMISVPMSVMIAPQNDAILQITATGTATSGTDYTMGTSTVTFPSGSTAEQNVEIMLDEDAVVEEDETIELSFTILSGDDAQVDMFRNTHTITVEDDDFDPEFNSFITATEIINDDFSNGLGDWLTTNDDDNTDNDWYVGSPLLLSDVAYVSNDDGATHSYNPDTEASPVLYQEINGNKLVNFNVSFDWECVGEQNDAVYDFGQLVYSINDGETFIRVPNSPSLHTQPTVTNYSTPLPSLLDENNFLLGFQWINDGGAGTTPLVIHEMQLTGDRRSPSAVKAVAAASTDTKNVGPNQTVHFYAASGDIMATIQNGSFDLGCTTLEIMTDGSGSNLELDAVETDADAASKTFKVTPTENAATADYSITLYYTQAEIDAWIMNNSETVTADDFKLFKTTQSDGANATAGDTQIGATGRTAYNPDGTNDHKFTAAFTGFSVFGGGNLTAPSLATELLAFSGQKQNKAVALQWKTAEEINIDHYEVQRKASNGTFETLGKVTATGKFNYTFTDYQPQSGDNYYRLKVVETNGKFELSNIINVPFNTTIIVKNVFPNPAKNVVFLEMSELNDTPIIQVRNYLGQLMPVQVEFLGERVQLATEQLAAGTYFIEIIGTAGRTVERVVINR